MSFRLQQIWQDTSPQVRKLVLAMWSMGAVLAAIGIWGDKQGFWSNKPFFTNFFSAVTTATFGIPVALIALQRLASTQASHATSRRLLVEARSLTGTATSILQQAYLIEDQAARLTLEALRSASKSLQDWGISTPYFGGDIPPAIDRQVREAAVAWKKNIATKQQLNAIDNEIRSPIARLAAIKNLSYESGFDWADVVVIPDFLSKKLPHSDWSERVIDLLIAQPDRSSDAIDLTQPGYLIREEIIHAIATLEKVQTIIADLRNAESKLSGHIRLDNEV